MNATQLIQHYIGDSDKLSQWMSGTEAKPCIGLFEADFSYSIDSVTGVRYACCGAAAAGLLDQ